MSKKIGCDLKSLKSLTAVWSETMSVYGRVMRRGQAWVDLYKAGGGDTWDFIKADFGKGGPVNLEIKPFLTRSIKVKNFLQDEWFQAQPIYKKAYEIFAISGRGGEAISFNPANPIRFSASTGSHEFAHTCQRSLDYAGWNARFGHNIISYIGQHEKSRANRLWRSLDRKLIDFSAGFSLNVSNYFARNEEMQARLHEMIVAGYQQWQKVPVTKMELWAVLINAGIDVPESIAEQMMGEEGQKALADFKLYPSIKAAMASEVSTFNRVQLYAGDADIKEAQWHKQYPLLYGELLEFYGDIPGRERMGLGKNPRGAIEVTKVLKDKAAVELSDEEARALALKIDPNAACAFINNTMSLYFKDNATLVTRFLLEREDVRQAVIHPAHLSSNNYDGLNHAPPLVEALRSGNKDMVRVLMRAGCNPFQTYDVVDMRGKTLISSSCPADEIARVRFLQEALEKPEKMDAKSRKFYTDLQKRESMIEYLNEKLTAVHEMMAHAMHGGRVYNVEQDGHLRQINFEQGLVTRGIKHNFVQHKPVLQEWFDPTV